MDSDHETMYFEQQGALVMDSEGLKAVETILLYFEQQGALVMDSEGLKAVETILLYFEQQGALVMDLLLLRRHHDEAAKRRAQSFGSYSPKTIIINFRNLLLIPISYLSGSFVMREKGGKCVVPGPGYIVDALKLSNQALRVSGESLQTCMARRCPHRTQHLFCWSILAVSGQSIASTGPAVDSRDMNLAFGRAEATHNKLVFPGSPNTQ
ncbi:hypothetical protein TNCV_1114011 [Trichonephila clavipes]|nr:hypothetical protein TNCV_1114011 [Trichonephila clavipes]